MGKSIVGELVICLIVAMIEMGVLISAGKSIFGFLLGAIGFLLKVLVLKIAKSMVAGRSVSNKTLDTPIVELQNIPYNELIYDNYVTVDLNGFKVSEKFCLYMQELKAALISILESHFYEENEASNYRFVTYEEAAKVIFSFIKQYLSEQKVSMTILERFFKKLELGTNIKNCFCGNEKDTWVHMLSQRLEEAIINAKCLLAVILRLSKLLI